MYLEAEKQMKMFKSCLTTQEIFSQQKSSCQGLSYRRIPIPDFCAPKEQVGAPGRGWCCCLGPEPALGLGRDVPVCPVVLGCLPGHGGSPGDAACTFGWAGMDLAARKRGFQPGGCRTEGTPR